jgi:hypothetical protein
VRHLAIALMGSLCVLASACGGDASEPAPSGIEEPIRLTYTPTGGKATPAQFFRGEMLPGTDGPAVLLRGVKGSRQVFPGEVGLKLSGNVDPTATAVAIRLAGIGTGYWVVPTTDLDDIEIPGKKTIQFNAAVDFSRTIPAGAQQFQFVAIDAAGHRGPFPDPLALSVQPDIPAAAAVALLSWDTNADLDLQIVTPTGLQLDRKHPRSLGLDPDGGLLPGTAVLQRDSLASCIPDGVRREMFVWQTLPAAGLYLAKADLFSACGEPGANFVFEFYLNGQLQVSQPGRFLAQDADNGMPQPNGNGPGLALVNFSFP